MSPACSWSGRPKRGSSSTTSRCDPTARAPAWGGACEDKARESGYDSIYLYTQEIMIENQALYARIGYTEYARRHEVGLDRVYMRKQLAPGA
jgi:hypothetical protein